MTDESTLPENAPTEADVRDAQEAGETAQLAGQPAPADEVEAARTAGAPESPSEGSEAEEVHVSTLEPDASEAGAPAEDEEPAPGQPAHPDEVQRARMGG